MNKLKRGLLIAGILLFTAGAATAAISRYWITTDDLVPRTTEVRSIGSSTLRLLKVWTKDLDASGTFTLGGVVGTGGIDLNGNDLIIDADADSILHEISDDLISFDTSGTDVLVIDGANSRVGIGTTGPGAKLDVRGSAIFNEDGGDNDFRIEGDTDANLFRLDAGTDKASIGYASITGFTQRKFEVVGGDLHVWDNTDLGSEKVTNGDFESWTGASPDNWTAYESTTVQESGDPHGGTYAVEVTTTGANGNIYQERSVTAGKLYKYSIWGREQAGDSGYIQVWDKTNNTQILIAYVSGQSLAVGSEA